ncbi:MAG: hypothetical protein U9R25_19820 [Chloroflexota bacterium]|nr:hypothetical protein [Chloroflexota bacterium]
MTKYDRDLPVADELLSAYLDGQVSETESAVVDRYLEREPDAARRLVALTYAVGLLQDMPRARVPRAFTLDESMVAEAGAHRWDWLAWLKPLYLRGAAALVAICLLVVLVGDISVSNPALHATAPLPASQGQLAVEDGDPTAIVAKTATSDPANQPAGDFLGLAPGVLLAIEIALAVFLVGLLLASWQLSRAP